MIKLLNSNPNLKQKPKKTFQLKHPIPPSQLRKFNIIPELYQTIASYGSSVYDKPPFVIVGKFRSLATKHVFDGLLACADNEFYAHLLCNEIRKNGSAVILRTNNPVEFDLDKFIKDKGLCPAIIIHSK